MRNRRSELPRFAGHATRATTLTAVLFWILGEVLIGGITWRTAQAQQSNLPQSNLPPPKAADLPLPEQDTPSDQQGPNIFLRPGIATFEREIAGLMQAGRVDAALAHLDRLIQAHPQVESLHFLKGLGLLVSDDGEGAAAAFETAWAMGDRQLRTLRVPDANLLEHPRIAALLEVPENTANDSENIPPPANIRDGFAPVEAETTWWDQNKSRLVTRFEMPPWLAALPVMTGDSQTANKLRELTDTGKAAGLAGILYDNRDRGHAPMNLDRFPQILATTYGDAAKEVHADYGLNNIILFERPVFGNSSTALGGTHWRSQGRNALTQPYGAEQLALGYAANQIYLFPEHLDHDPEAEGGLGDLFPANTPYMILTQGSSNSEHMHLEAVAVILAALPPATRNALEKTGLLAPTVQQIFRRGQAGIMTEDDYLSPRAHPTVFDSAQLELGRMIDLAQGMKADEIPPMVRLSVVSESQNISPFGDGMLEDVFTTPSAIARVHRTLRSARGMVVSAEGTKDPNGRPLRFHWVLLRGDPDKVQIVPDEQSGAAAGIKIDWHDRFSAGEDGIETQRVDIGVFAHNGVQWSAPAFVSVSFAPRERRVYDATGRLLELDHRSPAYQARYADPTLFADRDWTDRFLHLSDGTLTGWLRIRDGEQTKFTAHGLKVIETDAMGRPLIAEFVTYPVYRERGEENDGRTIVVERPSGRRARYRYASDDDQIGEPLLIEDGETDSETGE